MMSGSTKPSGLQPEHEKTVPLFDNWFDPIENGIRERVREFIKGVIREELKAALARRRKDAAGASEGARGHRHGSRKRSLPGTFGKVKLCLPRARLEGVDDKM